MATEDDKSLIDRANEFIDVHGRDDITLYASHPVVIIGELVAAIERLTGEAEEKHDDLLAAVEEWQKTSAEFHLRATTAEASRDRMRSALEEIARGYSGELGVSAESHSGSACVDIARTALEDSK